MSTSVGRVAAIAALVVGIPLACLAGVALYGKALSESDDGVGTLVSPEVSRRRFAEVRARFLAMTPAEHVAAARVALDTNYDPAHHRNGDLAAAEAHLAEVPATAAEQPEAEALRAEIVRRRREGWRWVAARIDEAVRAQGNPAGLDEARLGAMRTALAASLDGRPPEKIGGVHVEGDAGATLRLDRRRCDRLMLDTVAPAPTAGALRAMGFRAVRCGNGSATLAL